MKGGRSLINLSYFIFAGNPLLPRNCKSYERRNASHCPEPEGRMGRRGK
jgi:hypothetical protein